ncbi:MAG: hypothetical protein Q7T82_14030 [Armatimonadota bacterium]|nr:hypothetical protein [Armatimonadota bacterium]
MRQTSLLRRALDISLAAWGALIVFRFFAPIFGLERAALSIERAGAHVALLGLCLGLAAADAVFDVRRKRAGSGRVKSR